jgi:hypothetical protein
MTVNDLVDQALDMAKGVAEAARRLVSPTGEVKEPTAGELWRDSSTQLDKALAAFERKDSGSLPETSWFGDSQAKSQKEIDQMIDAVLIVLGSSGAAACRAKVRTTEKAVTEARAKIGRLREQSLSAPPRASLSTGAAIITPSREDLEQKIAAEERAIADMQRQVKQFKDEFRGHLREIGIEVSSEGADYFLLCVQDDLLTMAAVITHISAIAGQLQDLVDKSRENPDDTIRYYGIYVLLVYGIDRIQRFFIESIEKKHIPVLHESEEKALRNISDAGAQIRNGGPKDALDANIAASNLTLRACRYMADALDSQKSQILGENRQTIRMLGAAANTYRTVKLSHDVTRMIGDCQRAFQSLCDLKVPRLRPFENVQLKDEMQRLAENMLQKAK